MVNLLMVVGVTLAVMILGGGGMYLLWLVTRPKKVTWIAKVYQLGEGVRPDIKDRKGNIISEIQLSDLRPYTRDVLERVEKKPGIIVYRLQKLNKVTPAVTSEVVDYWGDKNKEVSVLLEGDTCTLLKKGYDRKAGQIFYPMPHDRMTMIQSEIAIRKDRLKEAKSVLEALTPWFVVGISMLSLVGIAYFFGQAFVEMSENFKEASAEQARVMEETDKTLIKVASLLGQDINLEDIGITEEEPPAIPDG